MRGCNAPAANPWRENTTFSRHAHPGIRQSHSKRGAVNLETGPPFSSEWKPASLGGPASRELPTPPCSGRPEGGAPLKVIVRHQRLDDSPKNLLAAFE